MNQSRHQNSPAWGSPAPWGSPAVAQAKLPNPPHCQKAMHPSHPMRIPSDPFVYPGAATHRNNYERRHSSHSQFNNSGCIPSNSPSNAHFKTPVQSSSTRFRQQRSHFLTPPYHLGPNVGHSFRTTRHDGNSFRTPTHIGHSFTTPNQLFNSPVRSNSGRQSLENAYHKQSPRFSKSSNPGASNHIENYYHPSMVADPWKFCKPVVRS